MEWGGSVVTVSRLVSTSQELAGFFGMSNGSWARLCPAPLPKQFPHDHEPLNDVWRRNLAFQSAALEFFVRSLRVSVVSAPVLRLYQVVQANSMQIIGVSLIDSLIRGHMLGFPISDGTVTPISSPSHPHCLIPPPSSLREVDEWILFNASTTVLDEPRVE
jgi:hypothetical protein